MKKAIISGLLAILLVACEGPEGPAGPPGGEFVGQIFEVDNVFFDYDSDNSFWFFAIDIPAAVEIFDSDVILAYRFVDFISDGGDGGADVWEMLPNVYFLDGDDIIQYVFNHTFFDVEVIIDGNFNLRDLDPSFTDDQLFRFAVVPAAFVTESGVDVADYEAVLDALTIIGDYRL